MAPGRVNAGSWLTAGGRLAALAVALGAAFLATGDGRAETPAERVEERAFATYTGILRPFPAFADLLGKGTAADVSGDGIPDLILGSTFPLGTSLYAVFGPLASGPQEVFPAAFYRFLGSGDFSGFTASHATAGDLNADGRADLVFGDGDHDGGRGRIVVRFGPLPVADETEGSIGGDDWLTITGVDPLQHVGWQETTIADLNRDGRNDLLIRAELTGGGADRPHGIHVFYGPLRAGTRSLPSADLVIFGSRIGQGAELRAADWDGDGFVDLYATTASGGGAIYRGPFRQAQELADPVIFGTDAQGFFPLDFNGDGRLDLGTSHGLAYGPTLTGAFPDSALDVRFAFANGAGRVTGLGDITGDNADDVLVADPQSGDNAGIAAIVAGAPQVQQMILRTGWNLVAWTGPDTPARTATASLAGGFSGLYAYDHVTGTFRTFVSALPDTLNSLDVLHEGEAVWIYSTAAGPRTWTQPGLRHQRAIDLQPGFNFVAWTGPDGTPVAQAIAELGSAVIRVTAWDAARQRFLTFDPALPRAPGDNFALGVGQGLWLQAARGVRWFQPATR